MNATTNALAISGIQVRRDAEGRYSLNDLHKAAGGEAKHKPGNWLQCKQTTDLIKELEIAGIPAIESKQRLGTFVHKDLVYDYAMWISAAFKVRVIRAYDALTAGPAQGKRCATGISAIKAEVFLLQSAASMLRMADSAILRGMHVIAQNHGIHPAFLPAYADEDTCLSLTKCLERHGSNLTATKANPALVALGYLDRIERDGFKTDKDSKRFKVAKWFWNVTEKGSRFGKNEVSPNNPKETQPLWFIARFPELLAEIEAYMATDAAA